jgi:hypothetical protein
LREETDEENRTTQRYVRRDVDGRVLDGTGARTGPAA